MYNLVQKRGQEGSELVAYIVWREVCIHERKKAMLISALLQDGGEHRDQQSLRLTYLLGLLSHGPVPSPLLLTLRATLF